MVYIPTEWFDGDTITAEKLNKAEEGIEEIGGAISNGGSGIGPNRCIFVNSSQDGEVYGEWKTVEQTLMEGLAPEENFSDESGGTIGFFGYMKNYKEFEWFNSRDLVNNIASFLPSMSENSLISLAEALAPYMPSPSSSSSSE